MRVKWIYCVLLAFLSFHSLTFAQGKSEGRKNKQKKEQQIFVANWNLENLFDTADDPLKNDEEFLPEGANQWTNEKLDTKFSNLAKVIRSMNQENGPDLLGVEEVENRGLLDTLITRHFKDKNYKVAYADCPDNRGIDIGIIYNADKLHFLKQHTDTVKLQENYPTRLILSAGFLLNKKDTLYVYVNHWPSRRGGENESDKNREAAASVLKNDIEGLLRKSKNSNLLILGDFNDEPSDPSLNKTLGAVDCGCDPAANVRSDLYNLAYQKHTAKEGSFFYQGNWNMLDNIIASQNLFNNHYKCGSFEVYKPEFMVTRNGKFKGAPFPTYGGKRYLGGYSDHFPVTALLFF